ncbi:MAG: hypothetical protein K2K60_01330, partial [Clostridia bacterium]|nr:hypothetical protein [Clostridia bacterium]
VKGHIDEVSGVCLLCQKWVNAGSKGVWELGNGIPQPTPFTVEAGKIYFCRIKPAIRRKLGAE